MTDSGHKIYFPFMTGTYVIRLPYFPAAVNLLASFIFQQIQFCYPAETNVILKSSVSTTSPT